MDNTRSASARGIACEIVLPDRAGRAVGDVHSLGPFYGRITESGAAADVTVTTCQSS